MTISRKISQSTGKGYGWWVRYDFTVDHKPKHQANFNDKDYGDKHASYRAAKAYEYHLKNNEPKVNPTPDLAKPNKTSRGSIEIPGIAHYLRNRKDGKGNEYLVEYFVASWQERPYRQRKKQFSVNKYGYDEAFRLAKETRAENISKSA